ncbi:Uncharacterized protein Fot_18893 [Forsythia ovata]|uniref:Uncharacterized protein n=1 Tax=Forsythia ovata TaxID=205694 RepID=A0ABD1VJV6_9LAMI
MIRGFSSGESRDGIERALQVSNSPMGNAHEREDELTLSILRGGNSLILVGAFEEDWLSRSTLKRGLATAQEKALAETDVDFKGRILNELNWWNNQHKTCFQRQGGSSNPGGNLRLDFIRYGAITLRTAPCTQKYTVR